MFEIFFAIDIAISLNTGYYSKGVLIMSRREIGWKYVKSQMIIDFLSSIPAYSVLLILIKTGSLNHINPNQKIFDFFAVLKLLRIFKIPKFEKKVSSMAFNQHF